MECRAWRNIRSASGYRGVVHCIIDAELKFTPASAGGCVSIARPRCACGDFVHPRAARVGAECVSNQFVVPDEVSRKFSTDPGVRVVGIPHDAALVSAAPVTLLPNDQIKQGVALRPGQQLHQTRVRKYSDIGSILLPRQQAVHTGGGPFDTLWRSLAMMVHVATVRQFMGHDLGSLVIGVDSSPATNKGGRRCQIERTRYPYLGDMLREPRRAKCLADDPFFQRPAFEKDRVLVGSVWSAVAVVEVDHAVGADFIRLEPRMNGQTGLRGQTIKTASGADLIDDKKILLLRRATNVFIGGCAAGVKAAVFFVKRQAISTIHVTH